MLITLQKHIRNLAPSPTAAEAALHLASPEARRKLEAGEVDRGIPQWVNEACWRTVMDLPVQADGPIEVRHGFCFTGRSTSPVEQADRLLDALEEGEEPVFLSTYTEIEDQPEVRLVMDVQPEDVLWAAPCDTWSGGQDRRKAPSPCYLGDLVDHLDDLRRTGNHTEVAVRARLDACVRFECEPGSEYESWVQSMNAWLEEDEQAVMDQYLV